MKHKKSKNKKKKEVSLAEGTWDMPALTGKCLEWVNECGRNCKDSKKISFKRGVLLSPQAISKIKSFMEKFPNIEWLGTLHGEIIEEISLGYRQYIIKDVKLAEHQDQGTTHARSLTVPEEDMLGSVHSHHAMGAFASSEDRSAALNWDLLMVVSYKGTKVFSAIELPCEKILLMQLPLYGNEFLTEALDPPRNARITRGASMDVPATPYNRLLDADFEEDLVDELDFSTGRDRGIPWEEVKKDW